MDLVVVLLLELADGRWPPDYCTASSHRNAGCHRIREIFLNGECNNQSHECRNKYINKSTKRVLVKQSHNHTQISI